MGTPQRTARFTIDGGMELERRIAQDVRMISDAAVNSVGARDLTAVILGGGYGRGEGAVSREGGTESVYNDYDFFVVTPTTSRRGNARIAAILRETGKRLEPEVGVHVDFGRPLPQSRLPHLPYELMMMELKMGHVVLHGPNDILAAMPGYDPERVPLVEGTRLLMNRSVGLIQARMLLRERRPLTGDEREFAMRNTYKALMAAGDAVLFVNESYSPSYARRLRIFDGLSLKGVPRGEQLRERYHDAIEFKLRPSHALPSGKDLGAWIEDNITLFGNVFLWFERQRLAEPDMGWDDYVTRPNRLPAPSASESLLNVARNLRARAGAFSGPKRLHLHPRDHILRNIPRLLYGDAAPNGEPIFFRLWEMYS